jgi:hypothetical protein
MAAEVLPTAVGPAIIMHCFFCIEITAYEEPEYY